MSNWNSWENDELESQLVSWKPRRPSPKLKTSLFPAMAGSLIEQPAKWMTGWRWLAPALVCSFMVLVALSPRNERLASLGGPQPSGPLSDVARNQKYAAYLTAGFHSEQNGPLRETLEWTFAPNSRPTASSLPAIGTNNLLH